MLKMKMMPKEFWTEVVDCTVSLSNHCPTKSIKSSTPQEAFSGIKPSVSHLSFFEVLAIFMCSIKKDPSLMIKARNIFSSAMIKDSNAISFMIQALRMFVSFSD